MLSHTEATIQGSPPQREGPSGKASTAQWQATHTNEPSRIPWQKAGSESTPFLLNPETFRCLRVHFIPKSQSPDHKTGALKSRRGRPSSSPTSLHSCH